MKQEPQLMFRPLEFDEDHRFEFGKNWKRFLRSLSSERIKAAEASLQHMLNSENLKGSTFLDVGSGSGLFSLAAHRLGASVVSFDFDSESVDATRQLKRSFSPMDGDWRIEQGSALDRDWLLSLGTFDVVYSWGVLHHTGSMWKGLENMAALVKQDGKLFIAIYNDQGRISDLWMRIKKGYNRTPRALRFLILWPIGFLMIAGMTLKDFRHLHRPRVISKVSSPRGMSLWRDIVDWVGGYPFEVASPDQIIGFYERHGFQLDQLVDCRRKLGCNQFVFTKTSKIETL